MHSTSQQLEQFEWMKNHEIGRILRDISQLETEFNQESAEAWRRVEHCFKSPSIRNSSSSTEVAWIFPNVQKEIILFAIIFHLHFFSECFNPIVSYCAITLYLLSLRSNSLYLQCFIQIKFVRFSYGSQTSEKHLKESIGLQNQEKKWATSLLPSPCGCARWTSENLRSEHHAV